MIVKNCTECNIEKDLTFFTICKKGKYGRDSKCRDCMSIIRAKNKSYRIEYVNNNKIKIKEYKKNYYYENKENIKNYMDTYRQDNKNDIAEYHRQYYNNNKMIICEKLKIRRENEPLYKLSNNMRTMIYNIFSERGYTKLSKTSEILGCSFEDFKLYLESKFEDWMTWENHGRFNSEFNYGWDIDHITPLSSALTEDDVIKLNHYTNLQPLCSYINRYIKRDRLDFYL